MSFITEIIDTNEEHSRLDKWMQRKFPLLSFTEIAKFVRKSEVRINGAKTDIKAKLELGDVISYKEIITKIHESRKNDDSALPTDRRARNLANRIKDLIIFEDDKLLAIDKPLGIASQNGSGVTVSIASAFKLINSEYRLVHRLDRDTSGVMVIAKNLRTAKALAKIFKERQCCKTYVAVSTGTPRKPIGEIHYPLLNTKVGRMEKMMRNAEGLACQTEYQVIHSFKSFTTFEVTPHTGRKHQIRAHLSLINCPILGDVKYGGKKHSRLMLHANRINFELDDEIYVIEAKLPDEFDSSCL